MNLRLGRKGAATLLAAAAVCGFGVLRAAGAPQYGTMVVERGSVTIIRETKPISFQESPAQIPVNELDIVRVRDGSRATLTTRDKGKVTFGANAIFNCTPWQAPKRSGVLRLLYGRMRAVVQDLDRERSFNVRTVEAIIGVKGTEYGALQTTRGKTMVLGIDHTLTIAGSDDVDQPVDPNQFASVSPGQPATPPFEASDRLRDAIANLNAPPPNAPGAGDLPTFDYQPPRELPQINLDDSEQAGARRRTGIILQFNP